MLVWNSSSQLTGQKDNVTPGDKSGPGKSTCRGRQRWALSSCTVLSLCHMCLWGCKWSYYSVCTSPRGSTHRWWPLPHLPSDKTIYGEKCCLQRAATMFRTPLTHSILEGLWFHQQVDAFKSEKKQWWWGTEIVFVKWTVKKRNT